MNSVIEPTRHCRFAAAILAGGQARRLGGLAKGTLPVPNGPSIVERLINQFISAGIEDIIIVANQQELYQSIGREIIPDKRANIGPLGGIESALLYLAGRCDAVVFMPCDLPAISAAEISRLKNVFLGGHAPVVLARTGKFSSHPLCAVVYNPVRPLISAAIDQGQRSVQDLWQQFGAVAVDFPDQAAFININTPADLEKWQAQLLVHS